MRCDTSFISMDRHSQLLYHNNSAEMLPSYTKINGCPNHPD